MFTFEGLTVTALPEGWSARGIYMGGESPDERGLPAWYFGTMTVDSSTVPYPTDIVELLGPDDAFVSVFEVGPDAAGSALYKPVKSFVRDWPLSAFDATAAPRAVPDRLFSQAFFTLEGRALGLWIALGTSKTPEAPLARCNLLFSEVDFVARVVG